MMVNRFSVIFNILQLLEWFVKEVQSRNTHYRPSKVLWYTVSHGQFSLWSDLGIIQPYNFCRLLCLIYAIDLTGKNRYRSDSFSAAIQQYRIHVNTQKKERRRECFFQCQDTVLVQLVQDTCLPPTCSCYDSCCSSYASHMTWNGTCNTQDTPL